MIVRIVCSVGLLLSACTSELGHRAEPYPSWDAASGATRRYLAVELDYHELHNAELNQRCDVCHHLDARAPARKCSSCHAQPQTGLATTAALHRRCQGCHQELARDSGMASMPLLCLDCHAMRK